MFKGILKKSAAPFWIALFFILLASVQLSPYYLWSPSEQIVHGLYDDDAFYYVVLADNLKSLGEFTFDRDMHTNGFQPLWMSIIALLNYILASVDSMTLLGMTSFIFYIFFAFLILGTAVRCEDRPLLITFIIGTMVVTNGSFQRIAINGMEVPLLLSMLMVVFYLTSRAAKDESGSMTPSHIFLLALFSSAAFFARTDWFVLPVVIFGWMILRGDRTILRGPGGTRKDLPTAVLFAASVALLVFPYLTYNLSVFGNIVPISGQVKKFYIGLLYPDPGSYISSEHWRGLFTAIRKCTPLVRHFPFYLSVTVILSVYGYFQWFAWKGMTSSKLSTAVKVFSVSVLVHDIVMLVYFRDLRPYTSYYFTPTFCWFVLMFCLWIKERRDLRIAGRFKKTITLIVLLFALDAGLMVLSGLVRERSARWEQRVKIASDLSGLIAPDRRAAAFWPGCFGAISGIPITPLDGLMGSPEYFEKYLQKGEELSYMKDKDIRHLLIFLSDKPEALMSGGRPVINSYAQLGTLRLWEKRESLLLRTVAFYPVEKDTHKGWYLIRIQWAN